MYQYILFFILVLPYLPASARHLPDSVKTHELQEVVVSGSYRKSRQRQTALPAVVVEPGYIREHFSGSLPQTLSALPGVQSMDIGAGFSKPVIRGMGFNRISVVENGIKQEGQQWGADHALEIDPFHSGQLTIIKGPSSLLYGSDAMGGVIEIKPPLPPHSDQLAGEVTLLGKSVNASLGGSVMASLKKNALYAVVRFTEQHFGDYAVPVDTVVYLTQMMPVAGRRLKNTAGFERNASSYAAYHRGSYKIDGSISNIYQKSGFFPGAHGVPDKSKLDDDGNSRDIGLPFSQANHFKVIINQQKLWHHAAACLNLAYQNNHREEWSAFHTHYETQPVPETDPDKELLFRLHTFNAGFKLLSQHAAAWQGTAGIDVQYQHNSIGGYSFLLPEYTRASAGVYAVGSLRLAPGIKLSGGLRYDAGCIDITPYTDAYLEAYLREKGYSPETAAKHALRSYDVNQTFGSWSGSAGLVWELNRSSMLKAGVGRSFRLPGANELASNGIHHGAFRHEQGSPGLQPEKGLQADIYYAYDDKKTAVEISPFISWFSNYIYLQPSRQWSVLPHAGQVYRYDETQAVFAGGEVSVKWTIGSGFAYAATCEYVYTCDLDRRIPLPFSPPFTCRNRISKQWKHGKAVFEHEFIAAQNRRSVNEEPTPGAGLLHAVLALDIPFGNFPVELTLSLRNILDAKYYNHLSFYRKIQVPEPGRSFQVLLKIPFKKILTADREM